MIILDLITIVVTAAYLISLLCGDTLGRDCLDAQSYLEGVKRSLSGQRVAPRG